MEMQVAHFPLHTPEQARTVIHTALTIAGEHPESDVHPSIIFREACRLLGARYTRPIPQPDASAASIAHLLKTGVPGA